MRARKASGEFSSEAASKKVAAKKAAGLDRVARAEESA
jgi:hypothetical protein